MLSISRSTQRVFVVISLFGGVSLAGAAGAKPPPRQTVTETYESPDLRLELSHDPYAWRLTDKDSGQILLSNFLTEFKNDNLKDQGQKLEITQRQSAAFMGVVTDAKSKQQIDVTVQLLPGKIMRVKLKLRNAAAREDKDRENVLLRQSFLANDTSERFYGLWEAAYERKITSDGEKRLPEIVQLDNRGVKQNLLGGDYGMRGSDWTSARAPFLLSNRKYGLYVNSHWKGAYQLGREGVMSFEFNDTDLEYYILGGKNYAEILQKHRDLAGASIEAPLWALGSIWWRDDVHTDMRSRNGKLNWSDEVVRNDVAELRALRVPFSTIHLDRPVLNATGGGQWVAGFGTNEKGRMEFDDTFRDAPGLFADLNSQGIKSMTFIANRLEGDFKKEAEKLGYLYKYNGADAADVRNPAAYEWVRSKLRDLSQAGIRGFKIDRGDEHGLLQGIVKEVPHWASNLNAILFPKLSYDALHDEHGTESFIFARTLYDKGRQYATLWNGDAFDWKGLRESAKHALRSGLVNFPVWTSDTGGYKKTNAELFARWSQFSAYSPVMEVLIGKDRTPWMDYDARTVAVIRDAAATKHELIPYVRSALRQATLTGMPLMRAMFLEFEGDPALEDLGDQYMFGSELLVAPVLDKGAQARTVVLPAGKWMPYPTGKDALEGGRAVTVAAPLESTPVFAREGAIIPHGDIARFANNWEPNWKERLDVDVYPSARVSERSLPYFDGKKVTAIETRLHQGVLTFKRADVGMTGALRVHCLAFTKARVNGRVLSATETRFDASQGVLSIALPEGAAEIEIEGLKTAF